MEGFHVFKIICGAGKHSKNNLGKIKFEVLKILENCAKQNEFIDSDLHADIEGGNFLIKIKID